jgi:hypothetical protein
MTLKTFRAVAEKSHGIVHSRTGRHVNPFHIRNVFDPNLKLNIERRTWDSIEATSERAARKLFAEACESSADMRGFRLVSLVEVKPEPEAPADAIGSGRWRPITTCGCCSYEEADGELLEQCAKCKAADAR